MLKWRHNVLYMWHLSVFRSSWKPLFIVFLYKIRHLVVSKRKNLLFVWGWYRKICPSRSPFVITQQASWCQSVILVTDFSIPPSHSWWIFILLCDKFQNLMYLLVCIYLDLSTTAINEAEKTIKRGHRRTGSRGTIELPELKPLPHSLAYDMR